MSIVNVPLKFIQMYHMDSPSETLPSGYEVCDGRTLSSAQQDVNPGGNYTLPDLRNRFILGADQTKPAGTTGVAVAHADIEGSAGAPGPKGVGGENDSALTNANQDAPHTHLGNVYVGASTGGGGNIQSDGTDRPSGLQATGSSGSSAPHENRPRYYGVVFIMRVKH